MKKAVSKSSILLFSIMLVTVLCFGCGDNEEADVQETEKAEIGISFMEDTESGEYSEDLQVYIDAIEKSDAEPVLLPLIENEEDAEEALDDVDALVLTGGEDIDPSYYDEEPDENLEDVNEERDTSDFLLLDEALDEDLPVLATCRGMQVLNVSCGGSLYQDIPTQYDTDILHRSKDQVEFEWHNINIERGSLLAGIMSDGDLKVNSWHHQGVKDLGQGLKVVAVADDGMIEAIEKEDETFVLGVQFHPEWHIDYGDKEFLAFFEILADQAENGDD